MLPQGAGSPGFWSQRCSELAVGLGGAGTRSTTGVIPGSQGLDAWSSCSQLVLSLSVTVFAGHTHTGCVRCRVMSPVHLGVFRRERAEEGCAATLASIGASPCSVWPHGFGGG